MKRNALLIAIIILAVAISGCQQKEKKKESTGKLADRIIVNFDDSSLQQIYANPEKVLENAEEFWKTDGAYKLVMRMHKNNNLPTPIDERWKKRMIELANRSLEDRQKDSAFIVKNEIMKLADKFKKEGIPHLCSFLPESTRGFESTIYFTSNILFRCFMTNAQVVFNLDAPYFRNDYEGMVNVMMHEVFHIGYGYNRSLRSELELPNAFQYKILDDLQNEGIASMVDYSGQHIFKNTHEKDFIYFDNIDTELPKALAVVNDLISRSKVAITPELRKEAWDKGVLERAYYITGFAMAKAIDEKLGREMLIKTISVGPRFFASTYNSIADDNLKVEEFELPEELSYYQKLKLSLLEKDSERFAQLAKELSQQVTTPEMITGRQLNSLGYAMISRKRIDDAIGVFKLYTQLFPNDPNAYDSLGEAYMMNNQNDLAIANYNKVLEINPESQNAINMLKKLQEKEK